MQKTGFIYMRAQSKCRLLVKHQNAHLQIIISDYAKSAHLIQDHILHVTLVQCCDVFRGLPDLVGQ